MTLVLAVSAEGRSAAYRFDKSSIRLGSEENSDLDVSLKQTPAGTLLIFQRDGEKYRIVSSAGSAMMTLNGQQLRPTFIASGDVLRVGTVDINLTIETQDMAHSTKLGDDLDELLEDTLPGEEDFDLDAELEKLSDLFDNNSDADDNWDFDIPEDTYNEHVAEEENPAGMEADEVDLLLLESMELAAEDSDGEKISCRAAQGEDIGYDTQDHTVQEKKEISPPRKSYFAALLIAGIIVAAVAAWLYSRGPSVLSETVETHAAAESGAVKILEEKTVDLQAALKATLDEVFSQRRDALQGLGGELIDLIELHTKNNISNFEKRQQDLLNKYCEVDVAYQAKIEQALINLYEDYTKNDPEKKKDFFATLRAVEMERFLPKALQEIEAEGEKSLQKSLPSDSNTAFTETDDEELNDAAEWELDQLIEKFRQLSHANESLIDAVLEKKDVTDS